VTSIDFAGLEESSDSQATRSVTRREALRGGVAAVAAITGTTGCLDRTPSGTEVAPDGTVAYVGVSNDSLAEARAASESLTARGAEVSVRPVARTRVERSGADHELTVVTDDDPDRVRAAFDNVDITYFEASESSRFRSALPGESVRLPFEDDAMIRRHRVWRSTRDSVSADPLPEFGATSVAVRYNAVLSPDAATAVRNALSPRGTAVVLADESAGYAVGRWARTVDGRVDPKSIATRRTEGGVVVSFDWPHGGSVGRDSYMRLLTLARRRHPDGEVPTELRVQVGRNVIAGRPLTESERAAAKRETAVETVDLPLLTPADAARVVSGIRVPYDGPRGVGVEPIANSS